MVFAIFMWKATDKIEKYHLFGSESLTDELSLQDIIYHKMNLNTSKLSTSNTQVKYHLFL